MSRTPVIQTVEAGAPAHSHTWTLAAQTREDALPKGMNRIRNLPGAIAEATAERVDIPAPGDKLRNVKDDLLNPETVDSPEMNCLVPRQEKVDP